jgi:hypothetical protein
MVEKELESKILLYFEHMEENNLKEWNLSEKGNLQKC